MKFADVKNDVTFRKIFGSENRQEILISFLNAVLAFEDDRKIVSVKIMQPIHLPDYPIGKTSIVDVKAIDQCRRTYLIEMQVANFDGLDKRALFYASRSYSSQITRGALYKELNAVFFIGILDFKTTQNENYISRHKMVDVETGEQFIKDIEFNFIELPKFNKKADELTSIIDQWIYFIKNAEGMEIIPENVTDQGLQKAYLDAEMFRWSEDEKEAYIKVDMREADEMGRLTFAVREAKREAKKEMAQEFKQKEEALVEKAKQEKEALVEKAKQKEEALVEKAKQEKEALVEKAKQKEEALVEKAKQEKEALAEKAKQKEEALVIKLLEMGVPAESISKATGLTIEEIKNRKSNPKPPI